MKKDKSTGIRINGFILSILKANGISVQAFFDRAISDYFETKETSKKYTATTQVKFLANKWGKK
jgi:hypothetical protein